MSSWDVTSSPSSKARSNSSDFIDPYLLIPCPADRDDPDPVFPDQTQTPSVYLQGIYTGLIDPAAAGRPPQSGHLPRPGNGDRAVGGGVVEEGVPAEQSH